MAVQWGAFPKGDQSVPTFTTCKSLTTSFKGVSDTPKESTTSSLFLYSKRLALTDRILARRTTLALH